ncbi:MAG: response regulator [Bacteriovoracaceae bacterium]
MNILVVDDNESIRDMIKFILESRAHKVSLAVDGFEALAMIQKSDHPYDALLTDYNMPNMTGKELIEKIIEQNLEIKKILMFSGEDTNEVKMESLLNQYRYIKFMAKPIEFDEVLKLLAS